MKFKIETLAHNTEKGDVDPNLAEKLGYRIIFPDLMAQKMRNLFRYFELLCQHGNKLR